jgi:hypothetical protein
MFCFGTILSVANEEGTLHCIADPLERKSSSKISGKIGTKQEKAQPPALRANTTFSKLGAEGLSTRRTPLSTSPTENGHGSQGKRKRTRQRIVKLLFRYLCPQRRTERSSSQRQFHSTPTSSSSGGWSHHPSPTMNQLRPGKNLLSGNPADEGTDAEIFGDIMRPESGTRRSPYHETRSRR